MSYKTVLIVFALAATNQCVRIEIDKTTICIGQPNNATVRSATSCRHYLICSEGKVLDEETCAADQSFDVVAQACFKKNEAFCMDYEDDPDVTLEQIERNAILKLIEDEFCLYEPDGTFVSSPESCRHYYRCYSREATKFICPKGYAFSEEYQVCDPEDEVACLLCPLSKSGIFSVKNPKYCNSYYECVMGIRHHIGCPNDMRFDSAIRSCVPRKNVECIITDVCRYRSSTLVNFLVRDENDCRKFVSTTYSPLHLY